MGGFGSGRQGGGPVVEDGLVLDINRLLRQRNIVAGQRKTGRLVWRNTATGEPVASLGYTADMADLDDARIELTYSVNGEPQRCRVLIANAPARYGGLQWMFKCPLSGRRVFKLYLPPGATIFACRNYYRLAYHSQRTDALDRSRRNHRRLYLKLRTLYDGPDAGPPARPKGMHQRTYDRLVAELEYASVRYDLLFCAGARRILARSERTNAARARRQQ